MATRKDIKSKALRNGQYQRASDCRYVYEYNDTFGKRRSIYLRSLMKLKEKEKKLVKDQLDGIDTII